MDGIILLNDLENIDVRFIDISEITLEKVKKQNTFAFRIDIDKLHASQVKPLIKNLLKIKRKVEKQGIPIGVNDVVAYIANYTDTKENNDILDAVNAICINGDKERYTYIYDKICDYLDDCFYCKNYCEFKDNRCGEKRNTNVEIGCCRHFKYKAIGFIFGLYKQCEYLKDYKCSAKCLPCKLFTCDFLEKKGIKFRIKDFLLLDTFFNIIQKYTLVTMKFTTEEKIINKLLKQKKYSFI